MKHGLIAALAALALVPVANAAPAPEGGAGQILHTTYCTTCHDSKVYTRKDHRVTSLDGLKSQLQGCSHMTKKEFTADEQQSLVNFLNDRYYHFK